MRDRIELGQHYSIRKMEVGETILSFDCGDEDLNDFILNEAPHYRKEMLAVSYVLTTAENPANIVAYCSLANDRLSMDDFPNGTDFNRFRREQHIPNAKRIKSYPAVKICRLAVDSTMKGQSAGRKLLNFIKSYFLVDNKTGCRFVTVDAYIDAIPFYERNGFTPLPISEEDIRQNKHTRPMFFDLNTIKV